MRSFTIKGDKALVVISVDEYENMKETIELLSLNPELLNELKKERKKMERGEFVTLKDYKKKYKLS
jgi:PHD/YefM family antitoxin component YafN of YafNO toxin-antitoxin module